MSSFQITQVDAILIFDHNGEKIAAKYYILHGTNQAAIPPEKQGAFEKSLLNQMSQVKDSGVFDGCILVENHTVVYHIVNDIYITVVGQLFENELILSQMCNTIKQSLVGITHDDISKEVLYEKLASVFLLLDDAVDGGIIMETDPNVIVKRLRRKDRDSNENIPFNQAIYNVRNNVIRTLLNS
ncbi:clathrin adaptor complex small chain, putative [Theileria equi strain WA]|uniref:Coatomer subunit zeta n=1 Tax=Theileria equi strain WA TaxID=1537102 RepID=L1LCZ4_THEEQ|nr:clathrin adaptor complex small chain, putative [Theileria equi strain WA]EKX73154.1 clathrin adaptor complex small chain, putative [Theileria equi strain WA]|eukprot:XP_004832606.1 clathrin adaptor complex small chain, putative [Theileria equi strain WA]